MENGPGATVTSWMTLPFCRMVTTALPSAIPCTTGANPRNESGSMRSSVATRTPLNATLSNNSPPVLPCPSSSWLFQSGRSRCRWLLMTSCCEPSVPWLKNARWRKRHAPRLKPALMPAAVVFCAVPRL